MIDQMLHSFWAWLTETEPSDQSRGAARSPEPNELPTRVTKQRTATKTKAKPTPKAKAKAKAKTTTAPKTKTAATSSKAKSTPKKPAPRKVRMTIPRAFISFEMEDRYARDFLVQHAKAKNNSIEFVDFSVQNAFDNSWKTQCKARIARTRGTIVLVCPTTHRSAAVLWEIAETARQKHHIFGIQINKDKTHPLPAGLSVRDIVRWDFDQITQRLSTWT
ncbi:MAG: hypothetical protein JWN72_1301 [Thermoleophilia bacterium]|nr:hypothetical protein [Thermoleophilia bacterium]